MSSDTPHNTQHSTLRNQPATPSLLELEHHGAFVERHIGPNDEEIAAMLRAIGHDSLDAMTDAIVPGKIRQRVIGWRCYLPIQVCTQFGGIEFRIFCGE